MGMVYIKMFLEVVSGIFCLKKQAKRIGVAHILDAALTFCVVRAPNYVIFCPYVIFRLIKN